MKKVFKSRWFICLLVIFFIMSVGVCAVTYFPSNQVTYDNSTSGLSSTNVQGAIDELYNECSSSISAGNYMYYANTLYTIKVYMNASPYVIASGSYINKCDLNGKDCSTIISNNNSVSINGIYVSDTYLYFSATNYMVTIFDNVPTPYVVSNGSNIFRCNLNGQSCSTIISNNGMVSIDNIYVTDNYIYYMISSYTRKNYNNSTTYYIVPSGNRVMRCNLNGQSCTTLLNNNGSISSNLFVK